MFFGPKKADEKKLGVWHGWIWPILTYLLFEGLIYGILIGFIAFKLHAKMESETAKPRPNSIGVDY